MSGTKNKAICSSSTNDTAVLQAEIARLQQIIAEITKERDAYRRVVQARAMQDVSEADIERYRQSETGLPLEDFWGELEQLSAHFQQASTA